jgi:type II secretory pathway pseudopilin PulG
MGFPEFLSRAATFGRQRRPFSALTLPPRQAGFALVEILVAALVVGIAAVGMAFMYGTGQALIASEGDNRVAVRLAQQRIDRIRATGFGTPEDGSDSREETTWTAVPGQPGYERQTLITRVCATNFNIPWNDGGCAGANATPEAKLVEVTVRAMAGATINRDPRTITVTLRTVILRR